MNKIERLKKDKGSSVHILYCPACGWMLRASWIAQEILSTFTNELESVVLEPAQENPGLFQIWIGDDLIWCRKKDQGFPQVKDLKKRIRDRICPKKDLGHLDRSD